MKNYKRDDKYILCDMYGCKQDFNLCSSCPSCCCCEEQTEKNIKNITHTNIKGKYIYNNKIIKARVKSFIISNKSKGFYDYRFKITLTLINNFEIAGPIFRDYEEVYKFKKNIFKKRCIINKPLHI